MPTPEHLGEQAIERLNANNDEILQVAEAGAQSAWVQMQIEAGWSEDYTNEVLSLMCWAAAPYPPDRPEGPGAFTPDQLAELRRLGWHVEHDDDYATRHVPLGDSAAGGATIRETVALLVATLRRVYQVTTELAWVEPPSPEQLAAQRAALLARIDATEAGDGLAET